MNKKKLYEIRNNTESHKEISYWKYHNVEHPRHLAVRERFFIIKNEIIGKTLDIGCGTGLLSHLLGNQVFGVDVQLKVLKEAKNYSDSFFCQSFAEELPFKNESFDTVILAETIEHIFSPEKAVAEIYRVLKIEGKLILTCPYRGKIAEQHIRTISRDYLRGLLYKFEIERMQIKNFLKDSTKRQIFFVGVKK
jgi:ubiquinone/menaquinone biosynthesis C-methylase UbiE